MQSRPSECIAQKWHLCTRAEDAVREALAAMEKARPLSKEVEDRILDKDRDEDRDEPPPTDDHL